MDGIKDIIRKNLSLQHRGKNMIWSLAMNEIKSYLKIKKVDSDVADEIITWYVRHEKLFLKTSNQQLKIKIFKEKTWIIENINKKLSEIGYKTEIKDIILK